MQIKAVPGPYGIVLSINRTEKQMRPLMDGKTIRKGGFKMFCHQCEQAAKGIGCDVMGVCGKKPEVAALQYNLLYGLK